MIGVAEAMSLGMNLGMDPHTLAEVINHSSGRCWSSDTNNPVPNICPNAPASHEYQGGFASGLMQKDLRLRSEERRVGKECSEGCWPWHRKKEKTRERDENH